MVTQITRRIIPAINALALSGVPAGIKVEPSAGEFASVTVRNKNMPLSKPTVFLDGPVKGSEEVCAGITLAEDRGTLALRGARGALVTLPSRRGKFEHEITIALPHGAAISITNNFDDVQIGDGDYEVVIASGWHDIKLGKISNIRANLNNDSQLAIGMSRGDVIITSAGAEMRFPGGIRDFHLRIKNESAIFLSYDLLTQAEKTTAEELVDAGSTAEGAVAKRAVAEKSVAGGTPTNGVVVAKQTTKPPTEICSASRRKIAIW